MKPPYNATIIIPAYNEEETIGSLLRTLLKFQLTREIIVVDDGSKDQTAKIVKGIIKSTTKKDVTLKLIQLPQNKGKAYAIVEGIKHSTHDIVVFCDADLTSITKEHIKALILPLLTNAADAVLAIRETDKFPFQKVTGERAYRKKDLLPYLEKLKNLGRGLEVFLNRKFSNKRTYYFVYPGLIQKGKGNNIVEKLLAIDDYLREGVEFLKGYVKTREELQTLTSIQKKIKRIITDILMPS